MLAKSIQFLIRGGNSGDQPRVYLNGTILNTFQLSAANGVKTMAADINGLPHTGATLTFQAAGITGSPFPQSESVFVLDAISFSNTAVPEPGTLALGVCSIALLIRRRRHN